MRRPSVPRLPGGPRPWLAALAAAAVTVPMGLVAVHGTGYPPSRVTLAAGVAWLASPGQGLLTLVDGPSELVVGSVRVPVTEKAEVVQVGSSALLVEPRDGIVRRVDGATYEISPPFRFSDGSGLSVLTGASAAYVVDPVRGTASSLDPATLGAGPEIPLGATPGSGQAVVDDEQRLWVVDGAEGGLSGFGPGGGRVASAPPSDAGPTALLTVVQGRPVVVDPAGRRAGFVGAGGRVERWACFPAADPSGVQLLGSADRPRVYAVLPETGELVVADLESAACPEPVAVGQPRDRFGPLVESNGFVLVPDETTGRVTVVDVDGGAEPQQLEVLPGGSGRLELVARDGLVFFNDLAGARTGVIRFQGRWFLGNGADKFRPGDGQPDILLASGSGEIPPDAAPPPPPPRGEVPAPTSGPVRPPRPPVTDGAPAPRRPTPGPDITTPAPPPPPPPRVEVPDFTGLLDQDYTSVRASINERIELACGDGTLCLEPGTRAIGQAEVPPPALPFPPPPPCLIAEVPRAGELVARGSPVTFVVDVPCEAWSTPPSSSPSSSAPSSTPGSSAPSSTTVRPEPTTSPSPSIITTEPPVESSRPERTTEPSRPEPSSTESPDDEPVSTTPAEEE